MSPTIMVPAAEAAKACVGTICLEQGSWADWLSGIGTFVAVLAALAGYFIADWYRRRDRREANLRTAQLIGMKVFRVLNSTADIHRHIWAEPKGLALGFEGEESVWRGIFPLIGLEVDDRLALDGAETSLLIQLKESGFLVELMLAISRLRSMTISMGEFRAQRDAFQAMIPPPVAIEGAVTQHAFTYEDRLRVEPYSIGLERLILSVREMAQENFEVCEGLAERFHPMMKRHYPLEKFIKLEPPAAALPAG